MAIAKLFTLHAKPKKKKKKKSNTKPNFKYCRSLSIQNSNIQAGVFLDKMPCTVQYVYEAVYGMST